MKGIHGSLIGYSHSGPCMIISRPKFGILAVKPSNALYEQVLFKIVFLHLSSSYCHISSVVVMSGWMKSGFCLSGSKHRKGQDHHLNNSKLLSWVVKVKRSVPGDRYAWLKERKMGNVLGSFSSSFTSLVQPVNPRTRKRTLPDDSSPCSPPKRFVHSILPSLARPVHA